MPVKGNVSKRNKKKVDPLATSKNYPTKGDVLKRISYEQEEKKLKAFKKAKASPKRNKPK